MIRSARALWKPILLVAALITILGAIHASSSRSRRSPLTAVAVTDHTAASRKDQARRVQELRKKLATYYPEK